MNIATKLLLSLALAFLAESMSEFVFAVWLDLLKEKFPLVEQIKPMRYVSLVVGIAMAFAYNVDLLLVAFDISARPAWVGVLLTGMAVGRGANYLHDFAKQYLGSE